MYISGAGQTDHRLCSSFRRLDSTAMFSFISEKYRIDEVKTIYHCLASTYIAGTFLHRSESIVLPSTFFILFLIEVP